MQQQHRRVHNTNAYLKGCPKATALKPGSRDVDLKALAKSAEAFHARYGQLYSRRNEQGNEKVVPRDLAALLQDQNEARWRRERQVGCQLRPAHAASTVSLLV